MNTVSDYLSTLVGESRDRYLLKISCIDGIDPYSLNIKSLSTQTTDLPNVSHLDIINYFVFKESAYTKEELKAFKSLESYNLYVCGWVKLVAAKKFKDRNIVLLMGKVLHSQRLNNKPLSPWIIVKEDGEIISAHCDCIAGIGETCSHVGAVLFAVESVVRHMEETTVTGEKAYWVAPSHKSGEPSKSVNIDYSSKKKLYSSLCQTSQSLASTPKVSETTIPPMSSSEIHDMLNTLKNEPKGSALHSVVKPFSDEIAASIIYNENKWPNLLKFYDLKYEKESLSNLRQISSAIDISMTEEVCRKIENNTRDQAKSSLWFKVRAGRVTASKFKAVCRTNVENPSLSLIKSICYPGKTVLPSKAIQYGCTHETEALVQYSHIMSNKHENFKVESSGLFINSEYPQFGASPDSIVECSCCGKGCVEIKCPYCVKDSGIEELVVRKKTYLKSEGTAITLDKNHQYYYQIVMQMAVTERTYCDFVVWSKKNIYVERIYFRDCLEFWKIESAKASKFFFAVLMPELLGKYFTNMGKCKGNLNASQLHCICREPYDGKMVECTGTSCHYKYFHFRCLNISDVPKKHWVCDYCLMGLSN